jgi:hypothetical protein
MPSEWDDALEGLGLVTPDNSFDPFASEKFANPAVSSALEGAGALVAAPGKLAAANPYAPGSEEAAAYERFRESAASSWAPQTALAMLGGGTGFVRSGSGELALGAAGAGPKLNAVEFTKLPLEDQVAYLAKNKPAKSAPASSFDPVSPAALAAIEQALKAPIEGDWGPPPVAHSFSKSKLAQADIDKQLASNPGASIFDLAGVSEHPSSAVKKPYSGYEPTQFHNLGSFPQEVPYAPPPPGLAQGYLTPAVHGTRLGEAIWETPAGVASDLGGLGAAHSQGLDALRLPPDELGVHFGTPEQAHQFTSTVTGGGYLPRTYPTVLQTGRSLELPDTGTWHVKNIQSALDSLHAGSGYGVDRGSFTVADPEAHIGEFPASERQGISSIEAMRDYLASKGYDSVNYINKVEGPGQRSYIMFKSSAEAPGFVSGVRSRFAKFDPSRVASPLLAAGVAGAAASPVLFDEKSKPYVLTK